MLHQRSWTKPLHWRSISGVITLRAEKRLQRKTRKAVPPEGLGGAALRAQGTVLEQGDILVLTHESATLCQTCDVRPLRDETSTV